MAEKLKVGIVGAGGITHAHLPYLKERSDEVELVGVAEINPATAGATADKYGIGSIVSDYRELIPQVQALLICVPTHLHAEIATTALEAGVAVFSEKPLARTLAQAEAIAAAAARSKAPLQIGMVRRFDNDWLTWREAILADKIGRPVAWRDVMAGPGPATIPWYTQEEKGGGPFLDGCIHNIDFALHTFGAAEWAFCHGRTLGEGHTAIDTGTATVRFVSGDELMLAWSWGLPHGVRGSSIFELLGPRGALTKEPYVADSAHQSYLIKTANDATESLSVPSSSINDAFRAQMFEFIEVARGEKQPRAGIEEGLSSLRLALAILESGRSGQVVRL